MIKGLQLHTSFAFQVRRHKDGPPVEVAISVTTTNDREIEWSINKMLDEHIAAMQELREGKLAETMEKRGISILMEEADRPEGSLEQRIVGAPTSIHRPQQDDSPF